MRNHRLRIFALTSITTSLWALAFGAGAAGTLTQDETLFWDLDPLLPSNAGFGATLDMAETEAGYTFGIVGSTAGAARLFELRPDETFWHGHTSIDPTTSQLVPVSVEGFAIYAALDPGGTTSTIRRTEGSVVIPTIDGGPVLSLVKRGTILAIGQPAFFGGSGRVRIYEDHGTGNWVLAKTFGGGFGDRLGAALAIDGQTVVAGAPGRGDNGAVHVYARATSWIELQVIDSPAASQVEAEFGGALAGDILAVGSPWLDRTTAPGTLIDVGGVYVYEVVTFPFLLFELQALLRPAGATNHDFFGTSVDLFGPAAGSARLVAGAPGEDGEGATNAGAIHQYARTGEGESSSWVEVTRMISSDPHPFERLGATVAITERGVLAGAPNGVVNSENSSGVVLFFGSRIFADGFESGDTSAWSAVEP